MWRSKTAALRTWNLAGPGTADRVLEAAGLWVAPGFIDIHSHSDFTLLADPRAMSSIAQGVTLEVVGNCGHGCAPLADPATARMNVYGYAADYPIDWRSVGQYLERLQERPASGQRADPSTQRSAASSRGRAGGPTFHTR